ncbi:mitochondrial ribosomal death-associated protein 3-domain-containing protein [Gorgonomyces haynaldii]|nr:mitochondrial ribosomal death-associated protein 3-domain-containing protein [Gorgonomyces haynaldii]
MLKRAFSTISDWAPSKATSASIGSGFSFNEKQLEHIQAEKHLKTQFAISNKPALLFRSVTHDLINAISETEDSKATLVVDGPRSSGKTATLMQTATHFSAKNWIVVHLKCASWISGIYPYQSSKDTYLQPQLALEILQSIQKQNEKLLFQVKSPLEKSMNDFLKEANLENSSERLQDFVAFIASHKERAPVLFCLDQANALYSNTAYHDKESNRLSSARFQIPSIFHQLANSELKNGSLVFGMDHSMPQIKSAWLNHKLKTIQPVNQVEETFDAPRYEDLSQVSEFGAVLDRKLDPLAHDLFASEFKGDIKAIQKYQVPFYSYEEVKQVLDLYKQVELIHKGSFTQHRRD